MQLILTSSVPFIIPINRIINNNNIKIYTPSYRPEIRSWVIGWLYNREGARYLLVLTMGIIANALL